MKIYNKLLILGAVPLALFSCGTHAYECSVTRESKTNRVCYKTPAVEEKDRGQKYKFMEFDVLFKYGSSKKITKDEKIFKAVVNDQDVDSVGFLTNVENIYDPVDMYKYDSLVDEIDLPTEVSDKHTQIFVAFDDSADLTNAKYYMNGNEISKFPSYKYVTFD